MPPGPLASVDSLSIQGHSSCPEVSLNSCPLQVLLVTAPFPSGPKGYTAFPLLLRLPVLQRGAPTFFMAFPDLLILPFVNSPQLPSLKFPSLSDVKAFLPGLTFISEDGSHKIGGVGKLVVHAWYL